MDVSIIIVSYNSSAFLKNCISSILSCNDKAEKEIIVVDNNSSDNSKDIIESFDSTGVKLIQSSQNRGFGGGNNLAFVQAKGRYLFFLNPDTKIISGCIDTLHEYCIKDDTVGVVGPRLIFPDNSIQNYYCQYYTVLSILIRRSFFRRKFSFYLNRNNLSCIETPQEIPWILGSAIFIKKELFNKLNGFDERYRLYFEDVDLCRRVHLLGLKVVYNPHALMVHYHQRESANGLSMKTIWHIESAFKYFNKFGWKLW